MRFKQGKAVGPLKKLGPARGTGTTIYFHPDAAIFPKIEFDPALISDRLEVASYLHKGLKIVFEDEASKEKTAFEHPEGLVDYLDDDRRVSAAAKPVHDAPFVLNKEDGLRLDLVLQWTEATDEHLRSYVNGIPTGSGGTHENGLRAGIGKAVRNFIETHNLSPKGVTLTAEDIREGVTGVLSVFIQEPQFQGQTKDRLNNPELLSAVDGVVRPALEHWLNHNISVAEAIVARIILAARAREASRAAQAEVSRKSATSSRLNLPGKLSDCTNPTSEGSELFVVEGDSAGGSAKQGRDRARQAILPLRGKVLNTESASLAKVLENKELSDLVTALGCGLGKNFELARLRYGKVIILADADSDGNHIATLLLTFIYRHLPQLIDERQGVPRAAAALPHRHRQGHVLGARRRAERRDPQAARQERQPRHAGDHAVQGPRRDDAEGAVGDDAQPAHPPPAARRDHRSDRDRSRDQRADGQGCLGALPLHHGAGRGSGGAGRLTIRASSRAEAHGRLLSSDFGFASSTRVRAPAAPIPSATVAFCSAP